MCDSTTREFLCQPHSPERRVVAVLLRRYIFAFITNSCRDREYWSFHKANVLIQLEIKHLSCKSVFVVDSAGLVLFVSSTRSCLYYTCLSLLWHNVVMPRGCANDVRLDDERISLPASQPRALRCCSFSWALEFWFITNWCWDSEYWSFHKTNVLMKWEIKYVFL